MKGIEIYNKKLPDISVLQAGITWVTGGSGTGKTSTMINTLAAQLYYLKEK
ncbi:MAG: hypothetical protein HON90_03025, partial [Halobacteriovoraceae bacterium]|nr:hypothetical protein [Halobacteriovoraceae bacterium]